MNYIFHGPYFMREYIITPWSRGARASFKERYPAHPSSAAFMEIQALEGEKDTAGLRAPPKANTFMDVMTPQLFAQWIVAIGIMIFACSFAAQGQSPQIVCPPASPMTVSVVPQICPVLLDANVPSTSTWVVDTHVHTWEHCYDHNSSACPPGTDCYFDTSACDTYSLPRRYTPGGYLPFVTLAYEWWTKSVAAGVLVQVSFMGTDNSYIIDQLRTASTKLRAVVVLHNSDGTLNTTVADVTNNFAELERYHSLGVRGIRLNLKGKTQAQMDVINSDLINGADHKLLWAWMITRGWNIEAQQTGSYWVGLIAALQSTGCRVVVDHFARPDKALNVNDPGFQAVLAAGRTGNVWMKASATYRLGVNESVLHQYAQMTKEAFGINRIIWGSDYPYTGCKVYDAAGNRLQGTHCEDSQSLHHLRARLQSQFPDPADQFKIFTANPVFLYDFASLTNPFTMG